MCNMYHTYYPHVFRVLVSTNLTRPRGLSVDSLEGQLYWTDQVGGHPSSWLDPGVSALIAMMGWHDLVFEILMLTLMYVGVDLKRKLLTFVT
jgi:hypothetical protein